MPEKAAPIKRLSDKSTKQELLEAYQALVKQLEEKRAAELNPEKRIEEKKAQEAVKAAAAVLPEGIDREIGSLKSEITKMLAEVSEKLATEAARFRSLQTAVESKERELQGLYGIDKAAASLAALIEAQNQKRREFEADMARQRGDFTREVNETGEEWEKEKKAHEAELRERDAADKKARDREELLKKEFEGERNVLTTRIEALEKLVKDLTEQSTKLSRQLEAAYQKVQEIAEKTIESAAQARSLADLQKLLVEQSRKQGGEK
jgi:hypothetical protein